MVQSEKDKVYRDMTEAIKEIAAAEKKREAIVKQHISSGEAAEGKTPAKSSKVMSEETAREMKEVDAQYDKAKKKFHAAWDKLYKLSQ